MKSLACTVVLLVGFAAPVLAQTRQLEVALGIAAPTRGLATARRAGPVARASLKFVDSTHGWQLRIDGEAVELRSRKTNDGPREASGAYRSLGTFLTLSAGPRRFAVRPYLLAGLGIQGVSIAGAEGAPHAAAGARYGGGVRVVTTTMDVSLEMARHSVLSDYGVGADYTLGGYRPLTLSITF